MNDFDLASRLKSVRVPERMEEYWDDFPSRIRVQLRRESPTVSARSVWRPRLVSAGGFALALALLYLGERFHPLQTASDSINHHQKQFRAEMARIETGLQLLMFNPHGMGYLLAEAN